MNTRLRRLLIGSFPFFISILCNCSPQESPQSVGLLGNYEYLGSNPEIIVNQKYFGDSLYHSKTSVTNNCLDFESKGRFRIKQDSVCQYNFKFRNRINCELEFGGWVPAQDNCSQIRNLSENGYEVLGEDVNSNPKWIRFIRSQ